MTKRPSLTDEQKEQIAELRGEQGWTYTRIAERLGIHHSTVSWHCLVAAIDKPGQLPRTIATGPLVIQRGAFPVRRFSPDDDRWLLALEAQGLNETAIARQMGRRRNSIVGRLATLARRDERALATNETAIAVQTPPPALRHTRFIGLDRSSGPDKTIETVFKSLPDGALSLVDVGEVIEGEIARDTEPTTQPEARHGRL